MSKTTIGPMPPKQVGTFSYAKMQMGYKDYSLNVRLPESFNCQPLSLNNIKRTLDSRNWFWRDCDQARKSRAIDRIHALLDKITGIQGTDTFKKAVGQQDVVSIYTTGSYPWHNSPDDIDIYFIVSGNRDFELIHLSPAEVSQIDIGILPSGVKVRDISLQVVGLDNLKKAAMGKGIKIKEVLQRKLLTLFGNGVHLGGHDLFRGIKIPTENFFTLAAHLKALAEISSGVKKEKRFYEANLVQLYAESLT